MSLPHTMEDDETPRFAPKETALPQTPILPITVPRSYLQIDPQLGQVIRDALQDVVPKIELSTHNMFSQYLEHNPAREAILNLRTTVLASAGLTNAGLPGLGAQMENSMLNTMKTLNTQIPGLQRSLAQLSTLTVSQVLSTNPSLQETLKDFARQLEQLEQAEDQDAERNEELPAAEVVDHLVENPAFEQAWQDVERMLRRDRRLRRAVKDTTRQLVPKAKPRRKKVALVVMVLLWLLAVADPWSDGEFQVNDVTTPLELLFTAVLASLQDETEKGPRTNLLQKNGPRRRRKRRKDR